MGFFRILWEAIFRSVILAIGIFEEIGTYILLAVAVAAGFVLLGRVYRVIRKKAQNACGKSGHRWNAAGCKCRRCGAENHKWEYLAETVKGVGGGRFAPRGQVRLHSHICSKCGKIMRSKK